jgi:hypothetical protein
MDGLVNGKETATHMEIETLTKGLESAKGLRLSSNPLKPTRLIKFVGTLSAQEQNSTPEILAGFIRHFKASCYMLEAPSENRAPVSGIKGKRAPLCDHRLRPWHATA